MKLLVLFALFVFIPLNLPAAKHKKSSPSHKAAARTAVRGSHTKSASGKSKTRGRVQKTSKQRSSRSSRKHPMVAAAPPRQIAPSNDRYREIQEALAAKGYLGATPNGLWDQNSQDAMRRFQADQNLSSSGKLTSRSIIALGLGSPTSPKPSEPVESPKQ